MTDENNPIKMKGVQRCLKAFNFAIIILMVSAAFLLPGCTPSSSLPKSLSPQMTYEIINTYPHDPNAFTQGLIYLGGFLYESTGLYGESSLRKVDLVTGEVLLQTDLSAEYFAEGLTEWEDVLIQLTWLEGTGFIYNLEDLSLVDQFTYPTEGWGLTHDGQHLIMSDGTAALYFLDPNSLQVEASVQVTYQGEPVLNLNELEFIRGEVFANIWQTDDIVRINPETGEIVGWIDLRGILPEEQRVPGTDVLNGIAYDPDEDRLFITGKRWPKLYEVRLVPLPVE